MIFVQGALLAELPFGTSEHKGFAMENFGANTPCEFIALQFWRNSRVGIVALVFFNLLGDAAQEER